jgi:hypothetical protein
LIIDLGEFVLMIGTRIVVTTGVIIVRGRCNRIRRLDNERRRGRPEKSEGRGALKHYSNSQIKGRFFARQKESFVILLFYTLLLKLEKSLR